MTGGSVTVQGNAGGNASGATAGAGGTAGTNSIAFHGGAGANGAGGATQNGSGGGGSAGSTSIGGDASSSTGGTAGTGAAGPPSLAGAAGASGAGSGSAGANGTAPGSGASGGGSGGTLNHAGGTGAAGQVVIIWSTFTNQFAGTASGTGAFAGKTARSGSFKGVASGFWAPPARVVNQWSGTFAQPASFQNMPPALQSTVIALTPASSVGGGTGTPSSGNWLFCLMGWNQNGLPAVTAGVADDVHSFWRPGDETASNWAVSTSTGKTRASVWYVPNLIRQAGDVYCAPNGAMAGMACLVVEVAGIGPWDTVSGINVAYSAAATSLGLALSAPSAASFAIAAVCGDSSAASQAFAPAGWSPLATVTASNGIDHSCDAVLTSACLVPVTGSLSVSASAGSATDLAGVLISVQLQAASPVPGGANVAWPGRVILEFAPGSGYETPEDQRTWVSINDNAWTSTSQGWKRFWSFRDGSGVPYALGQLQSSQGGYQLDNWDGALSPSNASGPWYPNIDVGTPIRLRMALGTIGGQAVNRWYCFSRNALSWPEKRNKAFRNFVDATHSDIWSVVAGSCPTPYRGEVEQDNPGWWWPCDDQALAGGVLPTSLRNAATGSSTVLNITASPNGVSSQDLYSSNVGSPGGAAGTDLTAISTSAAPGVAVYAVAQSAGFMYGDPQVSPQSAQTGNPVTAQPGSASWQQSGAQGNTGSHGWFLDATDTFPSLTTGLTIEGWFNYAFMGTASSISNVGTFYNVAGQPYTQLTLLELATASQPLAVLQLDLSGHLSLTTYNAGTGTSHAVYSGSDLRCNAWFQVTVTLTSSSWAVYVNGSLTASASGSATISPTSPTWFIVNGDLGASGGSSLSSIQHGGNVSISHLAIYPQVLPLWRVLAHYDAAITGFGCLPAPTSVQVSSVVNQQPSGFVTDGTEYQGSYGSGGGAYTFSALAAAVAGSYTSGPAARAITAGQGFATPSSYGAAAYVQWTTLAPLVNVYTSASAATETEAAACLGSGDSFTSGFGATASGHGVSQVSSGTGASPPTGPSALGDSVAQRIERVLGYGMISYPNRAIDASASLLVQAGIDVGGQQVGASLQAMVDSDNGLLSVDQNGTLCYRSRAHLTADVANGPVWYIGMNVAAGNYPFDASITFDSDPQRVFDVISISPYSPDGASLATVVPANATAVAAAQKQRGPRPKAITSYLQDQAKIQSAANWWFTNYSGLRRRVATLKVEAASHPASWPFILGVNPGDLIQVYDAPFGQPSTTGVYMVSQISRTVSYGANGSQITASATIVADPLPASFWS